MAPLKGPPPGDTSRSMGIGGSRRRLWIRRVMRRYWSITNPVIRPLAGRVPWWVLVETRGWRSGTGRRVPVAAGPTDGSALWLIAVHGDRAHWVRNIRHDPKVRLRRGRKWHDAVATIQPFDPGLLATFNAYARAGPRLVGIDPVLVRLELSCVSPGLPSHEKVAPHV